MPPALHLSKLIGQELGPAMARTCVVRRPAARLGSGGGAADQRRPLLQRLLAAIIPIAEDHGASGAPWAHQPRAARAAGAFGSGSWGKATCGAVPPPASNSGRSPDTPQSDEAALGGRIGRKHKCCAPFHAVAGTIRSACIRDAKQSLFPTPVSPPLNARPSPKIQSSALAGGPSLGCSMRA